VFEDGDQLMFCGIKGARSHEPESFDSDKGKHAED